LLRIIGEDFEVTDQLLTRYSALVRCWRKSGNTHLVFTDLEKAYDSLMREVLYNILNEVGILMKLERVIKVTLNETYRRVSTGKILMHFLFRTV
jgi:hypothetical protein